MRLLAILVVLCCFDIASACPIDDAPYAHGSAMRRAPLETLDVPPRPRFFVKGALPRFTTQGGERVPYTHAVIDEDGDISRVDLDVTDGWIRVEYPHYEETFWVTESARPVTRSVTRDGSLGVEALDIDSEATAFLIELADHHRIVLNEHTVLYPDGAARRIVALYADRREQVIWEREPVSRQLTHVLLGVLLLASAGLTWFVAIGPASGRFRSAA